MENSHQYVGLSSSELASLWTQYQDDSMAICFSSHSLVNIEDQDVREIFEHALRLSKLHIKEITEFFNQENYPVPKGFTNEDVNLDAPALFSDLVLLHYIFVMTLQGLTGYAGAIGSSVRADVRSYFKKCNTETMQLYDEIVEIMLQKGTFNRPPSLNAPDHIDFVKDQNYLNGWFGKQRPLNAVEISGLTFNSQKLFMKIVLEMGFSQVTNSKELRKYFQRGESICKKHTKAMSSILRDSNLTPPRSWESEITNSTIAPFSNKLMLFHVSTLVTTAIGFYGAGLSTVQRRDLGIKYTSLIADIMLYAEDGTNLMIKNGWLEQPPMASDRQELAEKNESP
ncbi:DUF3231 family protein [Alkalihalobacillus sp. AL-G]|uniref:DUF3231 family protein n=1 Tax=Alkalihalobacillus sp. AL-G TaxID=2926399 RepID=UPI00272A6ED7|nr:DUF3231 family protein [Alkalihalobacillus sp. AL-G]WLD94356.1 DUF3231 family protein [Alkalihalobacillus sp. AL-G]